MDNRTGKKYEIKVLGGRLVLTYCLQILACWSVSEPFNASLQVDEYGTIAANALKQIKAGGDGVGLRTYDPCALTCTAAFGSLHSVSAGSCMVASTSAARGLACCCAASGRAGGEGEGLAEA